jgi:DNA-binding NarL/FixJ family response regulator
VSVEELGMPIRVMLVEDHAAFRHVMSVLLAREPDLEMVAQAESLDEARQHCTSVEFDVVVLDLGLPDGNGADLIVDVRAANPAVGVLILSASLDPTSLQRVTLAGADKILDKLASTTEIAGAIRHLGSG